ncbi:hypothetical protein O6H91_02G020400 [Diphasiastrum complanatum]|uniref:Uncharacterized protein n=1 Tax=Diphasiastrum complanatum TaxID=34168 RepID=A0ACC2EDF2_DIPCM|nr:hypothetical protein O6H91_02G020400 [Diphasiastrum complanatum]
MEWACSRCTYVNRNQTVCEMCSLDMKNLSSVVSCCSDDDGAQVMDEGMPEWSCLTCTFLNPIEDSICEMCGGSRPDLSSEDPKTLKERILSTTKFWPLRNHSPPSNATPMIPKLKHIAESTTEADPNGTATLSALPPRSNSRKRKAKEQGNEAEQALSTAEDATTATVLKPTEDTANANMELKNANTFLGNLHLERLARQSGAGSTTDLEVNKRMAAIGDIIQEHKPHVISFQEVTPDIYNIFCKSSWWSEYKCSVPPELAAKRAYFCLQLSKLPVAAFYRSPFCNTIMGRELCLAELKVGNELQLVVATTHLESPCPTPPTWNQMFSKERVVQANESLSLLKSFPNVIFGGDMNWDDKLDGLPPLPDGWIDVWLKLHPDQPGLTYDSKANPMLTGSRLQKRLDRFFCHLPDFDIESIEMIGLKAIPNLKYTKEKKIKKQTQVLTLPVLPSDHFGLLLKITKNVDTKHF